MKSTSIIALTIALVALASCQKEENAPAAKGVNLTVSAIVGHEGTGTKTTYEYTASTVGMAGCIETSWEATENITVVSIGDSGITAIDEFISTGEEGRVKANFTGTWTGNEGDRVICLYPSIKVKANLFSGVAVGSSSIVLNSLASAYNVTANVCTNVNSLKDADVMVGEVSITGNTASVNLNRQISVFKVLASAPSIDPYYPTYEYLKRISLSAKDPEGNDAVFATSGSMAVTKSTYTGTFVPTTFGTMTFGCDIRTDDGSSYTTFFFPVFVKDELNSGYTLTVAGNSTSRKEEYSYYPNRIEIADKLHLCPGFVYEIKNVRF